MRMDNLRNRKSTRLLDYDYSSPGAYFLTVCTQKRKCILSRIVGTGVLDGPSVELSPYGRVADKYIRQMSGFYENVTVDSYVIMPNHIHILLHIKEKGPSGTPVPTVQNSTVSRFVSTFKRYCNREYGKNIWQYRSYDHIIRDNDDYKKHLEYIYENPFGWQNDELYTQV